MQSSDVTLSRLMGSLLAAMLICIAAPASALDTAARTALVIDHDTSTILLSKNADVPMPPASMSKLMTLFMVFEALEAGRLSLDDRFPVSRRAQDMGGSTMFLDTTDRIRVEDLIRGVIVQSGNDACVVLAEGLAGSEEAFAARMTERGKEIGLTHSTFANSTGWPHPDHRMSAEDLARIATRLIRDFPQYYTYFAQRIYEFDGRAPANVRNRNPLLKLDIGADGLKTGHTQEAGYGLVGSAERDGRRVTIVISGLESEAAREVEAERLITWGFREFQAMPMFDAGVPISKAAVWLGESNEVDLVSSVPITAMVPFTSTGAVSAEVRYTGPLEAPIAKGAEIAELVVNVPEIGETRFPLVAAQDVARGGFITRIDASARLLSAQLLASVRGLMN